MNLIFKGTLKTPSGETSLIIPFTFKEQSFQLRCNHHCPSGQTTMWHIKYSFLPVVSRSRFYHKHRNTDTVPTQTKIFRFQYWPTIIIEWQISFRLYCIFLQ